MVEQKSLKTLAAHINGLRLAMEAVMNGTTPDHAKWAGTKSFVEKYCAIAVAYISSTGDNSINVYDTSKLKGWASTVWPQQKGFFDAIYSDVLILQSLLAQTEIAPVVPIYNLLVSGLESAWTGGPFQVERSRFAREYTSSNLTNRFGNLDSKSIAELKKTPCIFAYEARIEVDPKFGYIREIIQRQGQIRVEYDIHIIDPFLTHRDLAEMAFELDISKFELHRTHWAIKEVNLPKELHAKGITLPSSVRDATNAVDVSGHTFDVALSFPGEVRPIVERIAQELERQLGPNTYFYDNNYVSQLARPSLDTLLQGIYSRAKLDVVFLSSDYQRKDWCGVEFRAIRDIIFSRENDRVMYVRTDDGAVDGVFKTDGYVDANKFSPERIAEFICERIGILKQKDSALQTLQRSAHPIQHVINRIITC